ncbi:MAG: polyprenyl synthetase family protein [Firmicutes bacterium]|nr:polyprenyl synthetase family protein [Bacillota bacterium]
MTRIYDPFLTKQETGTTDLELLQARIKALLGDSLEKVERILQDYRAPGKGLIREQADYVLAGRGKRLRPVLLLLCGNLGTFAEEYTLVRAAAAVELIHTASLIHDDVIDASSERRGRLSLNDVFGNRSAVLVGDFFFARAFELLAYCGDFELNMLFTRAIATMCEGEIEQAGCAFDLTISEEDYFANIYRKTGVLLEASCGAGGRLAALDDTTIGKLEAFGRNLGLAFQITDDILDIVGKPAITGKPVGNDLREGNITLPLIYILQDPDWGPLLREIISRKDFSSASLEFLRDPSCNRVPLETCRKIALSFIEKALEYLSFVRDSPAKTLLKELALSIPQRSC